VAIQCRANDGDTRRVLSEVSHQPTADDTGLERLYLQALAGGCTTPFGCMVDGADLCLGLDVHGGWRHTIARREGADRARLLAAMQAAQFRETASSEWLYRKHRPSEVPGA
jgi:porphobilinogen deaminase